MIPFLSEMNLPDMIGAVGYLGIFAIVFVESGIPIGVFLPLPGDTLLFTAGLLVSTSVFKLTPLLLTVISAAILGDSAGYWLGKKFGPKIFTREHGIFLNKAHLVRAERFFEKYGRGALVFARFLPFFRTIIPISAGVGSMHYATFLAYNVTGAILWGAGVTALGYFLGSVIPNIDLYLFPILLLILCISGFPMVRTFLKMRKESKDEVVPL